MHESKSKITYNYALFIHKIIAFQQSSIQNQFKSFESLKWNKNTITLSSQCQCACATIQLRNSYKTRDQMSTFSILLDTTPPFVASCCRRSRRRREVLELIVLSSWLPTFMYYTQCTVESTYWCRSCLNVLQH